MDRFRHSGRLRVRRGSLLVAAGASLTLLVTACSHSPRSSGDSSSAKPASLSNNDIASFTWSLQQMPATVDLAKDANVNVQQLLAIVTEPLERVANDGTFTKGLATSVSQPNDETIVYNLPSGVKFSDGTPLTADDAVWSLQHVADAKAGAQTAGRVKSIQSITATGPLQVTVKLKQADPTARESLDGISYVQEKAFAEAHKSDLGTANALPIGTGPYKFTSLSPSKASYERNPYYTGTKPKPDKISFVPITDDNGARLAMRSGDIQQATVTDVKQVDQWTAIQGTQVIQLPANVTSWLVMDTSKPPFNDIHARKALAYAIDRQGVSDATYGPSGVVLKGMLPVSLMQGVAGSAATVESFLNTLPQYDFDLAKAKSELAQSATPNGFKITIPYTTSSPWAEPTVLNLQQNLKGLGISVTAKPMTPEQWAASVFAHQVPTGMQSMQLIASIPDPNAVLPRIVGQANIPAPGLDLANWTTPQIEQDLKTLTGSTDRSARWTATQSILMQIAQQVPYIPLYSPNFVTALAKGFGYSQQLTNSDLTDGSWVYYLRAAG